MASTGFNSETGAILTGFDHVEQSIGVILTTPIGSRVMRREFGSELIDLIDRPMIPKVILAVYVAVASALSKWEPRFALSNCQVTGTREDGTLSLTLTGTYYPRGHLGDFTPDPGEARVSLPLARVL